MARNKKGKSADKAKRASKSQSRPSGTASKYFVRETQPGLSLREAARTHYNGSIWEPQNSNLRDQKIVFISSNDAGLAQLEGTIEQVKQTAAPQETQSLIPGDFLSPAPTAVCNGVELQHFDAVVDQNINYGGEGTHTPQFSTKGFQPPPPSHRSSASSIDSSEDVVLFAGRQGIEGSVNAKADIENAVTEQSSEAQPGVLFHAGDVRKVTILSSKATWDDSATDWVTARERVAEDTAVDGMSPTRPSGVVMPRRNLPDFGSEGDGSEEDEYLADYVQNLKDNEGIEDFLDSTPTNAIGGTVQTLELEVSDNGDRSKRTKISQSITHGDMNHWSESEIKDFDEMSTSEEMFEAVDSVLSKRMRPSGLQYLVVWRGQSVDEARWILASKLTEPGTSSLIEEFEALESLALSDSEANGDLSDSAFEDERTDQEKSQDDAGMWSTEDDWHERDLKERQISRMTDEEIARLLAKQEELGMGSDELLLFDDSGKPLAFSDTHGHKEDLGYGGSKRKKRRAEAQTRGKGSRKLPFALRDDFLEGDDYGDFDIMDRERPSLKENARGKLLVPDFALSDSELEASLQNSWAADRRKKSLKKIEREELRAQGLLGKKNKSKPDLAVKYRYGMTMDQIRDEIQNFLMSDSQSLALPPLQKKDRKAVHEMVYPFGLNSKSVGSGKSRFPVLTKTSRTREYDANLQTFQGQSKRQFFSRMDRYGRGVRAPARGGAGAADLGYRDGEVVGASAPELGVENRGRAMLEKMGWSSGTALGALNNKGILEPVSHVVKKSRAGLG